MTLRRTALTRRSELRRTPMPRRRRELKGRASRSIARQRAATGPTPAQRNLVADRAGYCCELCRVSLYTVDVGWTAPHSFHHRQPRGAGGTSRAHTNEPYNILLVCGTGTTGCHGEIESHRTAAYAMGWLVKHGRDPAEVPVLIAEAAGSVRWVVLTSDGYYLDAAA